MATYKREKSEDSSEGKDNSISSINSEASGEGKYIEIYEIGEREKLLADEVTIVSNVS